MLGIADVVTDIFASKGFSFKEILNLLHYSSNCFEILLSDDVSFNFSKRTFDEALSMVSALVKRHGISITDVLQKTNYDDLKGAKLTAAQRLTQWMTNLRRLSSPVLIETKERLIMQYPWFHCLLIFLMIIL